MKSVDGKPLDGKQATCRGKASGEGKKALLIGIAYGDGSEDSLQGTSSDVQEVFNLFRGSGFRGEDIVVMKERDVLSDLIPTRKDIDSHIHVLVDGLRPGDMATQAMEITIQNYVKKRKTYMKNVVIYEHAVVSLRIIGLVTYDREWLSDRDPRRDLVDALPDGATLLAIFNCCHSGTNLNLEPNCCNVVWNWKEGGDRAEIRRGAISISAIKAEEEADNVPIAGGDLFTDVGIREGAEKEPHRDLIRNICTRYHEHIRLMREYEKCSRPARSTSWKPLDPDGPPRPGFSDPQLSSNETLASARNVVNRIGGEKGAMQEAMLSVIATRRYKADRLPSCAMASREARKKALLIGIRYQAETEVCLNQAHSDVQKMEHLLCRNYGFRKEDVVVMKDGSKSRHLIPTRENIVTQIRDLVNGIFEGDLVVFYYAGHGDQSSDVCEYEEDLHAEYLVTCDEQQLTDADLRKYLVDTLPNGAHLLKKPNPTYRDLMISIWREYHGSIKRMREYENLIVRRPTRRTSWKRLDPDNPPPPGYSDPQLSSNRTLDMGSRLNLGNFIQEPGSESFMLT
ncbi:hypothetical protein GLOTRDRAFT_133623 [Gloeophyllum trabeum ATCC 11539]|uniref:Peptidase C14 caspase domain-containing protein n=1 Tax=Gloeophyllum trabeum (strain ATCC 11539 / FP-39264 / Madison 617) TaxID=670483 RepID=S7PU76_GLOTA|nr:uncharacterized protein GLOTRDRAFT_133623 [Gloeophyllum trabeum ATCC 11539]EPQ50882.1 hypothetical protein GLOTRDRAFT_133623 [Gloeophyllum trabeum ATCC 11539]